MIPWATKCVVCLACLVGIALIALSLDKSGGHAVTASFFVHKEASLPMNFAFEKIGQGPLSLTAYKKKSIIPDMSKEIIVLAKNTRPDCQSQDIRLLLTLKSSNRECEVKNGEQIFLSCDSLAGGTSPAYYFSERKTPLWVRPKVIDKKDVMLEVGIFMPSKEIETFIEEKTQFIIQDHSFSQGVQSEEKSYVSVLKQAKLWGQDVIFAQYGASQYAFLKNKAKVEINSRFYFVKNEDVFEWNEGEWVPTTLQEACREKPLMQVIAVSPRNIEFEVWDEKGFYPVFLKVDAQPPLRGSLKSEHLPQSVRLRTSSQITCCLGKRRYILKEGDWVLKTKRGWKTLKKSKDVEDYLQHKIKGELYIIEGLFRENGKLVVKGCWLDEMRTQKLPFTVPVAGDRTSKRPIRKGKREVFGTEQPKTSGFFISSLSKAKEGL